MLKQIAVDPQLPNLVTSLPGPKAKEIIERDQAVLYRYLHALLPVLYERGKARWSRCRREPFPRFQRGYRGGRHRPCTSVCGRAIQKQAAEFLHMSGTDFITRHCVRQSLLLSHPVV